MTEPRDWTAVELFDYAATRFRSYAESIMPPTRATLTPQAPFTKEPFDYAEGRWSRTYQHYVCAIAATLPFGALCIETGMAGGVSTLHLLAAARKHGGIVVTIDGGSYTNTEDMIEQMAWWKFLTRTDFDRWNPRAKLSRDVLTDERWNDIEIDLFLHDSDHEYENQAFEYAWAWDHLKPGGFLISDDFVWAGGRAWAEFAARVNRPWYIIGSASIMQKG